MKISSLKNLCLCIKSILWILTFNINWFQAFKFVSVKLESLVMTELEECVFLFGRVFFIFFFFLKPISDSFLCCIDFIIPFLVFERFGFLLWCSVPFLLLLIYLWVRLSTLGSISLNVDLSLFINFKLITWS